MRHRLATALSAAALALTVVAAGFGAGQPAGADVPAGLTIVDTSQCADGNPFVGFNATNADPANPITLNLQFGRDGGPMGSPSTFVVVNENPAGSYVDAGGTARLLLTDDQGETVYDTGFVDPCATTEPAVWFEHDCSDTEMTMWVEIRNLPAGQAVVVSRQEGGAHSSHSVTTAPSTWPITLSPMEVGRIKVLVDGAPVFDSGERHLAADGTCNEPVPSLEDGPEVGLTSECIEGGARLSLAVDGDGDEVTYEWTIGDEEIEGSVVAGPGAVVTEDVPLGSVVGVFVRDAWGRSLLAEEQLAVTAGGTCTAAPVEDLAPVLVIECGEDEPVAVLGARNDGNVTTDGTVHWTIDGAQTHPPDGHFDAILPGEHRTLEVPVPFGASVSVYAGSGGGHEDVGEEVELTAPTACQDVPTPADPQDPPPAPEGQEGSAGPGSAPASPLPAPSSGAPRAVAPSTAVAGAQATQTALPRTGGDVLELVTVALGLLIVGSGLRSRAWRR